MIRVASVPDRVRQWACTGWAVQAEGIPKKMKRVLLTTEPKCCGSAIGNLGVGLQYELAGESGNSKKTLDRNGGTMQKAKEPNG